MYTFMYLSSITQHWYLILEYVPGTMGETRELSCGSFQSSVGVGDANELGENNSQYDTNQDRKKWEWFRGEPYLRC